MSGVKPNSSMSKTAQLKQVIARPEATLLR